MKHRDWNWGRSVGLWCPGVKREERDQRAEADQQKQKYRIGSRSGKNTRSGHRLQSRNIKSALLIWNQQIKTDQSDQQDNATDRKIDCDFPGGRLAITCYPNSNHQIRTNQRELVKRVVNVQI